jgi:hypothetical protein
MLLEVLCAVGWVHVWEAPQSSFLKDDYGY